MIRRAISAALLLHGASALAQAPGTPRPPDTQTWADEQRKQAWATAKLARSPRRSAWVTIRHNDRVLRAWIVYPTVRTKAPVVIVAHEVFGLTDSTRNTADEIAALGYVAITPDMLSGLAPNGGGISAFPTTSFGASVLNTLPNETVNAIFDAWADYGLRLPQANGKLALVGLSWGGGAAFRYAAAARHNPALKAVAVFYDAGPPSSNQGPLRGSGSVSPIPVDAVDVPVYSFVPGTDARVVNSLPATRAAMATAGKRFEAVVYPGADHGFMRFGEDPSDRNPANVAAARASIDRLASILGSM